MKFLWWLCLTKPAIKIRTVWYVYVYTNHVGKFYN